MLRLDKGNHTELQHIKGNHTVLQHDKGNHTVLQLDDGNHTVLQLDKGNHTVLQLLGQLMADSFYDPCRCCLHVIWSICDIGCLHVTLEHL